MSSLVHQHIKSANYIAVYFFLLLFYLLPSVLVADTKPQKTEKFSSAKASEKQSPKKSGRPRKSMWEGGLAFGGFHTPDYPGANESTERTLILPFLLYRGEILRNDTGGLRSRFINNEHMEFSFSVGAAFPARSSDNAAREGMKDLDWTGQLGPQLVFHLNHSPIAAIDFLLPVRFVFSTDFSSMDSRGAIFNPELRLRHRALFDPKSFFSLYLGPSWGTESLQDYFYEVPANYATSTRSEYDAQAGFIGFDTTVSFSRALSKDVLLYLGVSKNFFSNAKNRKSPLMRDIENESYFLGLSWTLYEKGLAYEETVPPMGGMQ